MAAPSPTEIRLRVATYNVEDLRTENLLSPDNPRLREIARQIRELHPDIILINEIDYDWPADSANVGGLNGERFVENYLAAGDSGSIQYHAFMPPSNTGVASGFDLDRSGKVVTTPPSPHPASNGDVAGRAYGGDAWGFGMYPGQYAFAILVSDRFEIDETGVRTFRHFRWSDLPDALQPRIPESGEPWYSPDAWSEFPLSSKTHVDLPIFLDGSTVLHVLASHPTPPAFDGPEGRNKRRNHDEIRFWSYYLADAPFLVDDRDRRGGLAPSERFVIMGDLNADPAEGGSMGNPIGIYLFSDPRVNGDFVPKGNIAVDDLDPDDTARWGLRVDYILPSKNITIVDGGIFRTTSDSLNPPSDHFPVWLDIEVPIRGDK